MNRFISTYRIDLSNVLELGKVYFFFCFDEQNIAAKLFMMIV